MENNCENGDEIPTMDFVYDSIINLPKFREANHCGISWKVSALRIHTYCPKCNKCFKLWGFGAPKEIQDVLVLAKEWLIEAGLVEDKKEKNAKT